MNKERELLQRVVENFAYVQDMHLIVAIQKLLNQPEQEQEQEPVAWMYEYAVRSSFDASFTGEWKEEIERTKPDGTVKGFNPTNLKSTIRNLVPLYTAPPKREPLSFDDLNTMWCGNPIDFARTIESIHGITGGEE